MEGGQTGDALRFVFTTALIDIAIRHEGFASRLFQSRQIVVFCFGPSLQLVSRPPVIHHIVQPEDFVCILSLPNISGRPVTVLPRLARLIEVVHVPEKAHARLPCETQSKEASQIAVSRSSSALRVPNPSDAVMFLQIDVHHIRLVVHVALHQSAFLPQPFIDLHIVDHIRRQVFKHHISVLVKEILSVQQQAFHETSVHIDLSVVSQFDARQLLDKRIEHRAFGHLKRIGVEHHGVFLRIELHTGCCHGRRTQHALFGGVFKVCLFKNNNALVPSRLVSDVLIKGFIAFLGKLEDVLSLFFRNIEIPRAEGVSDLKVFLGATISNDGAVAGHQFGLNAGEEFARHPVVNGAVQTNRFRL